MVRNASMAASRRALLALSERRCIRRGSRGAVEGPVIAKAASSVARTATAISCTVR